MRFISIFFVAILRVNVLFSQSIDGIQKFWDNQPCNINHSKRPIGTREYFEEVEKKKYFVEHHIPPFAEFTKWKNKEVLEIGCGIGTDSINFARAGAHLTVVELSEKSLEIAKQRFAVFGLSANFILCNAETLSSHLKGKQFDLVYSFGVIHHVPNPSKIIEEITHVLKPGGELRIMLYAKYSLKNLMIQMGLCQPEAQKGCPIAAVFSKREALKLLQDFEVYSFEKDHIFPYKIKEYKNSKYVKKFPWNIMPQSLFRLLEKTFGWHCLIKARYHTNSSSDSL